jgi:molybdopterin molybdotransferase
MISVDYALSIILDQIKPLGAERVPIECCLGRILAEDIIADIDLPPFDRARMDGYALRSQDASSSPVTLRLIGEVAAGAVFEGTVGRGEAVKIFTGAPIPKGADAVQKVEVTESDGQSVLIKEAVRPGQFITARASEVVAGQVVLEAGGEIGPAEIAVLASFGYASVCVGRKPKVAVLSTGSELVDVSEKPSAAQIRNSNSYTITSYAQRAGAEVSNLGKIPDTLEATCNALLGAAESSDIVITSGGVSMGDYDLVKVALNRIGAEIYFDRVRIRPGKPVVLAKRGKTYFFGLPGNPVSTCVTFNVFARPAIRIMQGERGRLLTTVGACLTRPISDASSRRSYLPARLFISDGRAQVEPLRWGGSSDLVAAVRANALIVVREDVHSIEAGELVEVMLLSARI